MAERKAKAMTLREMQGQREQLVAEARERLDNINANTDESRVAELEEQHDNAMSALDDLDKKIERELALHEAEQRAVDLAERANAADIRRPSRDGEARGVDEGDEPMSYREAFHDYLRNAGQVGAMSPQARSALSAGYEAVETRAQSTTDAAGGYTVPEELQAILIRSMAAWGPMYDEDVATVITTASGNPLPMPTVNDTAVTAAAAPAQGTTLTDDGGKDVTFGEKRLESYSFDTEWIRCSLELAQDSIFAMENLLGDLLGERLGRIANSQLTTGTGSSAPNGIVTASTLGVTAASATAVTYDEIINLEHSVDPAYRNSPKVRFMFNDTTLRDVRKLKDGQGNYLWQMGNVQAGVPNTLNGKPYSINQAMASIATGNKTFLFGDFGKYYVRKVGSALIGAIQDKDFWPGFGIAGYIRFDGELGDTAAVKHLIQA